MYFGPDDFLYLNDIGSMPDSSSWTFEAWVTPLEDVSISGEQQIYRFEQDGSSQPSFEAFLGPNCKCVTVRLNGNAGSTISSSSLAQLNIP